MSFLYMTVSHVVTATVRDLIREECAQENIKKSSITQAAATPGNRVPESNQI